MKIWPRKVFGRAVWVEFPIGDICMFLFRYTPQYRAEKVVTHDSSWLFLGKTKLDLLIPEDSFHNNTGGRILLSKQISGFFLKSGGF